jgi:geranylgeranyl diphosphate synthase type I
VEAEMQRIIAQADAAGTAELHAMLTWHMGWTGDGAGPDTTGKRIRPLLVLLTAGAAQPAGDTVLRGAGPLWLRALPAAASVEILHNFSLIHDDIQDNSPLRRGRPTVWKKWGVAQAINAGDVLYTLAYSALLPLGTEAVDILQKTCLSLTQGQYLDISFEERMDVSVDEYWAMIGGKTAALLAACTELGALAAGADSARRGMFREFGRNLGLAFQVQDDLLGIWGDPAVTGKSAGSDLAAGKKSLPVLYGLAQGGAFAARWAAGAVTEAEAGEAANLLAAAGAQAMAQAQADALTAQALGCLEAAEPQGEAGSALVELANALLGRKA